MFVDVYTAQKNGNQALNIFLLILWISKAKNQENGLKAGYAKSPYSTATLHVPNLNMESQREMELLYYPCCPNTSQKSHLKLWVSRSQKVS